MFCSELTTLLDGLKYLEVVGLDSTIKSCAIFQNIMLVASFMDPTSPSRQLRLLRYRDEQRLLKKVCSLK